MRSSNPKPDEEVSAAHTPVLRLESWSTEDEAPPSRWPRPLRSMLGRTMTSIVAVVVVIVGGVLAAQWATRSTGPSTQDSALSGVELTIPLPSASADDLPIAPSEQPSATRSAKASPTLGSTAAVPAAPVPDPARPTSARPQSPTTTGPRMDDEVPPPDPGEDLSDDPAEEPTQDEDPPPGPEIADPSVNLAASAPVEASSQVLPAGAVTDSNPDSYWESGTGFPQTVTVDLGEVTTVGRLGFSLPARRLWPSRIQTIAVYGSPDGGSYRQIKGATQYEFRGRDTSNQVSTTLPQSQVRFLRLEFTGNSGWPAAQLSELSVHSS